MTNFPYKLTQNIHWADMDAYEHINNAVFFRYFEDVRMHVLEEIGANDYMTQHNLGPILARTEADYRAPLIYPDTIDIKAAVTDIQDKKFTMLYQVYSHKLQTIACEGKALIVYYDYNQNKSCAIPDVLKQALINN